MIKGDIVEMKTAKIANGNFEIGVSAKSTRKGDRLIFLYLGHQDHGSNLDAEEVLRSMGWVPMDEVSPK